MRVIATERGYCGVKLREPGEEFDMPDGAVGSWFVSAEKAKVAKPKASKPTAKDDQDSDDLV